MTISTASSRVTCPGSHRLLGPFERFAQAERIGAAAGER
jgi:hypothetical protein